MTNFIYIFMIIALIGIGVGIKAFNSEDSDTKTNVKNIPRFEKGFIDWKECT